MYRFGFLSFPKSKPLVCNLKSPIKNIFSSTATTLLHHLNESPKLQLLKSLSYTLAFHKGNCKFQIDILTQSVCLWSKKKCIIRSHSVETPTSLKQIWFDTSNKPTTAKDVEENRTVDAKSKKSLVNAIVEIQTGNLSRILNYLFWQSKSNESQEFYSWSTNLVLKSLPILAWTW